MKISYFIFTFTDINRIEVCSWRADWVSAPQSLAVRTCRTCFLNSFQCIYCAFRSSTTYYLSENNTFPHEHRKMRFISFLLYPCFNFFPKNIIFHFTSNTLPPPAPGFDCTSSGDHGISHNL